MNPVEWLLYGAALEAKEMFRNALTPEAQAVYCAAYDVIWQIGWYQYWLKHPPKGVS